MKCPSCAAAELAAEHAGTVLHGAGGDPYFNSRMFQLRKLAA